MDKIDETLNPITGLTCKERKNAMSWLASLPESQVIEVMQDAVSKSFKLKDKKPELPGKIVKYCALILAIRKIGWDTIRGKGYRVAGEEQYQDFNNLRAAKTAKYLRRGRAPDVKDKVLAYWGEVKEIKSKGGGFRAISRYLAMERKIRVSPSYLQNIWAKVEQND